jgi:chromosome segregation ATPase
MERYGSIDKYERRIKELEADRNRSLSVAASLDRENRELQNRIAELKAERDGWENGQMQMQTIAGKLFESNNALSTENTKLKILITDNSALTTENARLTAALQPIREVRENSIIDSVLVCKRQLRS